MDLRIVRSIIGGLREVDRSGYELWRWIGAVHGHSEALTEANLYPTLHRLEAERLIIGTWQDSQPSRRMYRIAARGSAMAVQHHWPAVVRRVAPTRLPVEQPGAEGEDLAVDVAADVVADVAAAVETASPEPAPAANRGDYLDRLERRLRLCGPQRRSIRSEIDDHLRDSAAELRDAGLDEQKAEAEAMARLGSPETLAEAMSRSQLTLGRLLRGIPPAAYVAAVAGGIGAAGGAACLLLTPLIARLLSSAALHVGLHLYAPESGEWYEQQLLAGLWVGSFMAGRMSLRRLADETRRHERSVTPWWALGVGSLLLALAAVYPMIIDPASAVGLLGVPVAFVAGCLRYQTVGDDPISRKGAVAAAAILLLFVLMPGVRTFAYVPSPGTHGPAAETTSGVSVQWDHSSGHWMAAVEGVDSAVWHDVQIEFWPAVRQGPFIVPDPGAATPLLITGPDRASPSGLKNPPADYWVAVTAAGPDGQRRTIYAEVHQSDRMGRVVGLLSWLLGDR
jgi:DNA-binding PadR family transcriptional regulator